MIARAVVLGLLLAGLTALVSWEYAPAMRGGFVYEDFHMTDVCAESFDWGLGGRKVTLASWCWQLAQQHAPWAWHAVNLGLHLTVTALVGRLLWHVTDDLGAVLLATVFFGVNAVGVEAVAYLSSRSELIAAIGVLGACLAALRQRWLFVGPLLLLGWWGKESASVALLLVPLCQWYRRGGRWAWGVVLGGVVLAAGIWMQTLAWWTDAPSRGAWALLQTTAMARVAMLAVLPFGQTVDYDYARVPVALQVFATAMVAAGIAWAALHRHRLLLCGAAWTACACAPRLLVPTPRSVFPEHQFYLPLVGLAIMLASVVGDTRV